MVQVQSGGLSPKAKLGLKGLKVMEFSLGKVGAHSRSQGMG